MKLINSDISFGPFGSNIPYEKTSELEPMLKEIEPNMLKLYGEMTDMPPFRNKQQLLEIYVSIGNFQGKNILDLGCGAKDSWNNLIKISDQPRRWEPWTCRCLHELGANIIGIDGADSPNERYTHLKKDLYQEKVLADIPDNSLDLACAFSIFDAMPCDGRGFFDSILARLENKLKPEGIFLFDPDNTGLYKKQDWEKFIREFEARKI